MARKAIAAAGGKGKAKILTRRITPAPATRPLSVRGSSSVTEIRSLDAAPKRAQSETRRITAQNRFAARHSFPVSSVKATRSGGATQKRSPARIQKKASKARKAVLKSKAARNAWNGLSEKATGEKSACSDFPARTRKARNRQTSVVRSTAAKM